MTRKAIGDRAPIRRGRRIRLFSFEQITGEGAAPAEGSLSGTLTFDATSLTTKNKQRDKHLREGYSVVWPVRRWAGTAHHWSGRSTTGARGPSWMTRARRKR